MMERGRFLFLCPDVTEPSGGVQKIYEFAQALFNDGSSAYVVHSNAKYRANWFVSDVPVVGRNETVVSPTDLLVVPEFMTNFMPKYSGCAKVILNQNSFVMLSAPFLEQDVVSIVVVSEHIRRYSEFAHPGIPALSICMGYDKNLFFFGSRKKRQIAFMPRKRLRQTQQILQALRNRGDLSDWSLVPIEGMNAKQVAKVLRESMIFLSFSEREGFGLPPLEAMACGCLVVGFHGHGGTEFFDPAYCYPIPEDDLCSFQETLAMLLNSEEIEQLCRIKGAEAARQIGSTYTMQRQTRDVLKVFHASMSTAHQMTGLKPVRLKEKQFDLSLLRNSAKHIKKSVRTFLR